MNRLNLQSKSTAKTVALVGAVAATIECGKLVLSFLPNVEVVTLLCALFGYVFGWTGVVAAAVFVMIEPLIWGFGPWFVTYLIYWPTLALLFMFLRRNEIKNRWVISAVAVLMTVIFGVISAVIDTALYIGINAAYPKNLLIYYLRGISFYLVQISCNAVLFPMLFVFLSEKLLRIKQGFVND